MLAGRIRLLSAIAAVLATAGVGACTSTPAEPAPPVIAPGKPGEPARTLSPGETVPRTAPNDADIRFMRNMIIHHAQAIEMAKLAPQRAAAEDVKKLADRIGASQGPEIQAMNAWLHEHGQPTLDPEHAGHEAHEAMPGMATQVQLDELASAKGADFDRMFLQLMITHHEGALAMAGEIQLKGRDVRIQEIADDVIATQSAEINRMRALLPH